MALHEILTARHDEVMQRWKAQVRGTLAPQAMPTLELVDHIPEFVDEIVDALRADAGLPARAPSPETSATAAGHGEQRLRLGFSLDSVVREYGALRDAIVATAREAGAELTFRELQILFDATVDGIADAVTTYAHQRDAELLRQANEHFAFVAHELRNPLATVKLAFQILQSRGLLPENNRSVLSIERGLKRLAEQIDQTLQTARVASGIELCARATTLTSLFEDAVLGATPEAEAKGTEIRVSIEQDQELLLDARLVRSALGNLVRNAVKYSEPGHPIELRGNIAKGRVAIEVEDHCGGLKEGQVEAAFAPFVRLDHGGTGFGLGLAIAKQAVDAHGGSIRVQNLPGKGCIFVLELPLVAEPT